MTAPRAKPKDAESAEKRQLDLEIAGGVTREQALKDVETIWALASPDLFVLLTDLRGWSRERYADWLGGLLMERGVDRIAAEELTVPPGGDELFALLRLQSHHESGEWDVVIVDCAPTGETLRLLSFPDAARWWLDKVFGRGTTPGEVASYLVHALIPDKEPS